MERPTIGKAVSSATCEPSEMPPLAHPALASILAERGLTVGPVFEQLEQAHTILRRAGFSDIEAVRTFYTLFTYVFGFVIWELPRVHQQPATSYADAWNAAIDQLDIDTYPTMHALRDELATAASTDQFEYGLNRLIGSLRSSDPKARRTTKNARPTTTPPG